MQSFAKFFIWTGFVSLLLVGEGFSATALACNYYASPSGGGNGLSPTSPFKIADFWAVAGPGKTLCLLDGVYSGSNSMVKPPENLNGTSTQKITIRALNDGAVRIDGGTTTEPVRLRNNDHFIIEGINANGSPSNSVSGTIVLGAGADNNIIRRVVAWDAGITNDATVFLVYRNTGNLLEDVAGFGDARKIYSWYLTSDDATLTIRRAWGRWERSTNIGPKMTYSSVYNSSGAIFENVLGTWDETAMGGSSVDQPYGIFQMDRHDRIDTCVKAKILGSIAYLRGNNKAKSLLGVVGFGDSANCATLNHVVVYIEPGTHTNLKPFNLEADNNAQKFITRVTEIGGARSAIGSGWSVSGREVVNNVSAASNIWIGAGSQGARVCKRYVNETLTSTPLWPWPMNQRIIDAMKTASKTPVDVTKTMEEIFGPIPSECRSGSIASAAPAPAPTASVPTPPASLTAR
jgi:hypothetical protein